MSKDPTLSIEGHIIHVDPDFFAEINPEQFSAEYWRTRGMVTGEAGGRHKVCFVNDGTHDMLLRHYYRGGVIARFSLDRFIYVRLARARSIREFRMLRRMFNKGLPVPRPCAASVQKRGLFYRCDILLERLPGTLDLARILGSGRVLSFEQWINVGKTIALFHQYEVYHRDLNCHNIMLDKDGKCWVVDFDRCSWRKNKIWKWLSLRRLQRSLLKELKRVEGFRWKPEDWGTLMEGYRAQMRLGDAQSNH